MSRNNRIRFCDNNLLAETTSTPSATALNPFSNATSDSRSQTWVTTGLVEVLEFDFLFQRPIGFIGIIGPHDQQLGLTLAATITVEGNNVNDFASPPFTKTVPITDEGALAFLDTDAIPPSFRFWRITLDDSTSSASSLTIGHFYFGDYQTLEQRNVQKGFTRSTIDPSKKFTSENGSLFFDQKTKYLEWNGVSIGFLLAADRLNLEAMFTEFGISRPMFVSFDPILKVTTDLHELTRYMVFKDKPILTQIKTDTYTMALNLREHV